MSRFGFGGTTQVMAQEPARMIDGWNGLSAAEQAVADNIARVAAETSAIGDLFGRIPNLDMQGTEVGVEFVAPVSASHKLGFRWTPGIGRGAATAGMRVLPAEQEAGAAGTSIEQTKGG